MSENGDTPHVVEGSKDIVEEEDFNSDNDEVILSPQEPITWRDIRELIQNWEVKFEKMTEGVRALEMSTHDVHTHLDTVTRESRARESALTSTNRQIDSIKEALARFMEAYDPARPTPVSTHVQPCAPMVIAMDQAHQTPVRMPTQPRAPTMSTPITPPGAPPKFRSEFSLSPVIQATPAETMRADRAETRVETMRADRDMRGRDPNERPAHDNGIGMTMNTSSRLNNTATRNTSSPKVPVFDGTVSAHLRPWLIQFEAIARHQCWTSGEKVVRLVASLTGPAANMLIGMTMGQLDDYAFLAARLSRRYDPPEREEAHCAELRARTRRRNESADEFAENLKNLAQRAYPNADQNMLDNMVVERFREGHNNIELKKHLCLYPSTGLQDLIGACVRFETHVELGARSYKPNECVHGKG